MRSLAVAVSIQLACQLFKVVYYSLRDRRLRLALFLSTGGMPSAHAAFVTALGVSVGLRGGFESEVFAVAVVFALIVIYDAFRLRAAVGEHARLLAALLARHPELKAAATTDIVGHSFAEIMVGMVVGGGLAALAWRLIP